VLASPVVIICKLKEVAQLRGYSTATALTHAMRAYFKNNMSESTLHSYWNDSVANINRETLDRLCEFLDVEPGLIIKYISRREAELALKKSKK
jgi:DNA-binding Xre family transcriptional regulator